MNAETVFQIAVGIVGSLATAVCALAYFRRVRLERPPIGVFNSRDLCVLGVFIVALPVLYVHLPPGVLTAFIVVTFLSALTIALRPLFASRALWVAIPLVLTADIVVTRSMDHMRGGLQLYWLLTSAVSPHQASSRAFIASASANPVPVVVTTPITGRARAPVRASSRTASRARSRASGDAPSPT